MLRRFLSIAKEIRRRLHRGGDVQYVWTKQTVRTLSVSSLIEKKSVSPDILLRLVSTLEFIPSF